MSSYLGIPDCLYILGGFHFSPWGCPLFSFQSLNPSTTGTFRNWILIHICFSKFSLRMVEAKLWLSATLVASCYFYSLNCENQYFSPFSESFSLISINVSPCDSSKPQWCAISVRQILGLVAQLPDLGQTWWKRTRGYLRHQKKKKPCSISLERNKSGASLKCPF